MLSVCFPWNNIKFRVNHGYGFIFIDCHVKGNERNWNALGGPWDNLKQLALAVMVKLNGTSVRLRQRSYDIPQLFDYCQITVLFFFY